MYNGVKRFSIGDATYAYEVSGKGIPIVLLHGFTGSRSTWSPFVAKWKKDFQIITVDLPGHGETTVQSNRSMKECCHDLAKLFEHIGLTTFHLLGYSMGGRVALSFAHLYPSRISSLLLESASPGLQSSEERKERIEKDEKLAQRIESEGVPAFVDYWEQIPLFESQKSMPELSRQSVRNERLAQSKKSLAMSLRFMGTGRQPSLWEQLNTFKQPVLLIVGKLDQKFVDINKQMKGSLKKADVVIIEKVGHAVHVEKPQKFGKLVTAFILNNDSQGGF